MNRWIVLSLLLVLLLLSGLVYRQRTAGLAVRTAPVRRGEISEYVDERGKTRLRHTFDITMPFTARLEPIQLDEGDTVAADQIVAQVDRQDLENELEEAQAVVQRLQASIAENEDHAVELLLKEQAEAFVTSMLRTVDAAEERKTAGLAWRDYAQWFFDQTERLHARDAKTEEELELAKVQLIERSVDYEQDKLVWESLNSILAATRLLPRIIAQYISHKSLSTHVLEQQKAEAEAQWKQATLRVQRGTIRSPIDGVVLAKFVDDEQFTSAGTVLLQVGRMADLEVEVDVLSQEATRIRPGAAAEIYAFVAGGQPTATIPGTVRLVYPQAFTKISSLGVEEQRVKVIVAFPEDALAALGRQQVGAEYRVRVRIFTNQEQTALIIPRSALFRSSDGRWQVFVVRDGRARLQDVSVGLMNDETIQVEASLEEDEEVILAPENDIQDGTRVQVTL
jgi:HlyD family secretion protein